MTLELTAGKSRYQYRISPSDKCSIQRRINKHGARWEYYTTCQTAQDAKAALLAMQDGAEGEQQS